MSNVLERNRSLSRQEFYRNMDELAQEVSAFMLREKNVPKKYRGSIYYPTDEVMEEMLDLIRSANRIRPETPEQVEARKAAQQKCIDHLDKIYRALQKATNLCWKDKMHRRSDTPPTAEQQRIAKALDGFANRLAKEESLLMGWKNSTKLIVRKKK